MTHVVIVPYLFNNSQWALLAECRFFALGLIDVIMPVDSRYVLSLFAILFSFRLTLSGEHFYGPCRFRFDGGSFSQPSKDLT